MRLLRLCLRAIGGWPNLKQDRQTSMLNGHVIYMLVQTVVVIGEVTYLYQNFGVVDFLLIGDVYLTTFLTVISMGRLYMPYLRSYYCMCTNFLTEFHLIHYKHKGDTYKEVFLLFDKISLHYIIFLMGTLVSGLVSFNLSPMYVNFKNGAFTSNKHNLQNISLQFAVNYQYPGYNQREHFYIATIVNFFLSYLCSVSVVSIDMLLVLMIFQVLGHLEILSRNMQSIPKPKTVHLINEITEKSIFVCEVEMYDIEENVQIKQILKELILHHNVIISFTERISTFFGPMLGLNYLFQLLGICLLLLECTQGDPDAIFRFGPLTMYVLMQLAQASVIFEIVNSKNISLIHSVYALPWQYMSVENQRIVYFMLCRVQKPVQIVAFGLVGVGVQTMANILKTTFSYYTFLQTM
ncbi:uncharacterized protein [Epargyreus clarus]|uniref:uncharacterized protein n=1 Tax=Epargyreus clarus TaxID=520877 RepID=UPI003C2DA393